MAHGCTYAASQLYQRVVYRLVASAIRGDGDVGVERAIEPLDPREVRLDGLDGRQCLAYKSIDQLARAEAADLVGLRGRHDFLARARKTTGRSSRPSSSTARSRVTMWP